MCFPTSKQLPGSPSLGHSQDCAWCNFPLCQSPRRLRALTPRTGSTGAMVRRERKRQSLLLTLFPPPPPTYSSMEHWRSVQLPVAPVQPWKGRNFPKHSHRWVYPTGMLLKAFPKCLPHTRPQRNYKPLCLSSLCPQTSSNMSQYRTSQSFIGF